MADSNTPAPRPEGGGEPPLGDLVRQLARDSAVLLRQEVALARAEFRSSVKNIVRDAVLVGVGGILALLGTMVLLAFLVLALGDAVDSYRLGALVTGAALVVGGVLLAMRSLRRLRHGAVMPTLTLDVLREDPSWIASRTQGLAGDDDTKGYGRPKPSR